MWMGLWCLKAAICEVYYQAQTNFNSTVLQNAHDKRFCQKLKLTTITKKKIRVHRDYLFAYSAKQDLFLVPSLSWRAWRSKKETGICLFFSLIEEEGFGSLGLGFGQKDITGWEIAKSDWPWSDLTTHPRYPTSHMDYFLQSSVRGRLQRCAFSTGDQCCSLSLPGRTEPTWW